MQDESYCVNEPSVISEVIDGETIVLNFESGHYYSFNASASEIWQSVASGVPVTAVAEHVARRFAGDPAAIRCEVEAFVRRLADESLIRRSAGAGAAAAATATATAACSGGSAGRDCDAFASPTFEKFTDMEELLLLDPIHEVSDTGWPRKPE